MLGHADDRRVCLHWLGSIDTLFENIPLSCFGYMEVRPFEAYLAEADGISIPRRAHAVQQQSAQEVFFFAVDGDGGRYVYLQR